MPKISLWDFDIHVRPSLRSEISLGWRGYQDLNNRRNIISHSNTHLWRGRCAQWCRRLWGWQDASRWLWQRCLSLLQEQRHSTCHPLPARQRFSPYFLQFSPYFFVLKLRFLPTSRLSGQRTRSVRFLESMLVWTKIKGFILFLSRFDFVFFLFARWKSSSELDSCSLMRQLHYISLCAI